MRFVPSGLFGRLVVVLLAGLAVAQLVTLYINWSERDQLLYQTGGMRVAQRIADLANLLDSMAPAERRKIAALFDGPPLAVDLERPAVAVAPAAGDDFQRAMFVSMLRYSLADGMEVTVMRGDADAWRRVAREEEPTADVPMMGHGMHGRGMMSRGPHAMPSPGASRFVVQVRLRDGSLATFDSYLSPQEAAVPTRIALTLLVMLILVVALSLIAVRWLTVPLRTLAAAAEDIGRDLNHPPLRETGPTEVRQAAKAFNTMQQRLARFVADRTRVLAAMSHDLKTPITRMRLRTELLEDDALRARFGKDLDEMEAMVTQALDYMRDATSAEPAQRVDVDALLESLSRDYEEAGGDVSVEGRAATPFVGRPLALRRCLTNLVDNALRYGKRAMIRIIDTPATLTLHVDDEGPGLPEDQLERAFEPFFRGDASRNRDSGGTGLGLSIARNIARAHGGDVVLRNRAEGGLEATVTLPR
jgi:signal transduction histidine kinase